MQIRAADTAQTVGPTGTATLTFTVNAFADMSTGTLMSVGPASQTGNSVAVTSQANGANVQVDPTTGQVTITGGLAKLTIAVNGNYIPVVLFFLQNGAPNPSDPFGTYTVNSQGGNTTITLPVSDPPSSNTSDFYVLITEPGTGKPYGLIDPRIIVKP
jgi:hypothetical protein